MSDTKVYAVTFTDWDGYSLLGLFSSRELAQKYIDQQPKKMGLVTWRDDLDIDVFLLDNPGWYEEMDDPDWYEEMDDPDWYEGME